MPEKLRRTGYIAVDPVGWTERLPVSLNSASIYRSLSTRTQRPERLQYDARVLPRKVQRVCDRCFVMGYQCTYALPELKRGRRELSIIELGLEGSNTAADAPNPLCCRSCEAVGNHCSYTADRDFDRRGDLYRDGDRLFRWASVDPKCVKRTDAIFNVKEGRPLGAKGLAYRLTGQVPVSVPFFEARTEREKLKALFSHKPVGDLILLSEAIPELRTLVEDESIHLLGEPSKEHVERLLTMVYGDECPCADRAKELTNTLSAPFSNRDLPYYRTDYGLDQSSDEEHYQPWKLLDRSSRLALCARKSTDNKPGEANRRLVIQGYPECLEEYLLFGTEVDKLDAKTRSKVMMKRSEEILMAQEALLGPGQSHTREATAAPDHALRDILQRKDSLLWYQQEPPFECSLLGAILEHCQEECEGMEFGFDASSLLVFASAVDDMARHNFEDDELLGCTELAASCGDKDGSEGLESEERDLEVAVFAVEAIEGARLRVLDLNDQLEIPYHRRRAARLLHPILLAEGDSVSSEAGALMLEMLSTPAMCPLIPREKQRNRLLRFLDTGRHPTTASGICYNAYTRLIHSVCHYHMPFLKARISQLLDFSHQLGQESFKTFAMVLLHSLSTSKPPPILDERICVHEQGSASETDVSSSEVPSTEDVEDEDQTVDPVNPEEFAAFSGPFEPCRPRGVNDNGERGLSSKDMAVWDRTLRHEPPRIVPPPTPWDSKPDTRGETVLDHMPWLKPSPSGDINPREMESGSGQEERQMVPCRASPSAERPDIPLIGSESRRRHSRPASPEGDLPPVVGKMKRSTSRGLLRRSRRKRSSFLREQSGSPSAELRTRQLAGRYGTAVNSSADDHTYPQTPMVLQAGPRAQAAQAAPRQLDSHVIHHAVSLHALFPPDGSVTSQATSMAPTMRRRELTRSPTPFSTAQERAETQSHGSDFSRLIGIDNLSWDLASAKGPPSFCGAASHSGMAHPRDPTAHGQPLSCGSAVDAAGIRPGEASASGPPSSCGPVPSTPAESPVIARAESASSAHLPPTAAGDRAPAPTADITIEVVPDAADPPPKRYRARKARAIGQEPASVQQDEEVRLASVTWFDYTQSEAISWTTMPDLGRSGQVAVSPLKLEQDAIRRERRNTALRRRGNRARVDRRS